MPGIGCKERSVSMSSQCTSYLGDAHVHDLNSVCIQSYAPTSTVRHVYDKTQ